MLVLPSWGPSYGTLIGQDPGSDTLGVGMVQIDLYSLEIVESQAHTLHGSRLSRNSWQNDWHGERQARIHALADSLLWLYVQTRPILVGTETSFINVRRPAAYGALVEVIEAEKRALYNYDPCMVLQMIAPSVGKNAVGVNGGSNDKDEIKRALMTYSGLNYTGEVPIANLDSHSCDGLAIALGMLNRLRGV